MTAPATKSVADILNAAADLLEPEGAWTQGAYGRLSGGREALNVRADAICRCAVGAIFTVAPPERGPLGDFERGPEVAALRGVVGGGVTRWNDAPERTQAEVVAALRFAAEKARADAQSGSDRYDAESGVNT